MKKSTTELFDLGRKSFKKDNYEKAEEYWTKAAKQGHAKAQLLLGTMYHNGYVYSESIAESIYWLKKAAEQKNKEALDYLINLCEDDGIAEACDAIGSLYDNNPDIFN